MSIRNLVMLEFDITNKLLISNIYDLLINNMYHCMYHVFFSESIIFKERYLFNLI